MSQVNRICSQCGESVPLQDRYCSECGYDTSAGLPAQRESLPVKVGRAALPVIAGLAGIALRSGLQALHKRVTRMTEQQADSQIQRSASKPIERSSSNSRRVIRIRSSWAVGDANGVWRQGREEHTIEIEE